MKIKTIEQLQDKLDKDLAWRKKELIQIKMNINDNEKKLLNTNLRIGIAFLYSHWEGYIKNASSLYLQYITMQKLNYKNLSSNFLAISLKNLILECGKTEKTSIHVKIPEFFENNIYKEAKIPYKDAIQTKSNLNSKILKEIVITLGLDYSFYELKENLIDIKLVDNRNKIAHGRYISIDINDFEQLYSDILSMIDNFENQIIEAAKCSGYLAI